MIDFDMPPSPASFEGRGGWITRRVAAEFGLTLDQAAGLVGNLGYESGGFEKLHEIGQPVDQGGYGWGQWTGPRRRSFMAYCIARALPWQSDEANYGFLVAELHGAYSSVIAALKRTATLDQATWCVGQTYERPGGTTDDHLPGYGDRLHWAQRARAGATVMPDQNRADEPAGAVLASEDPLVALCKQLQQGLADAGFDPGSADGYPGTRTFSAMSRYRKARGV